MRRWTAAALIAGSTAIAGSCGKHEASPAAQAFLGEDGSAEGTATASSPTSAPSTASPATTTDAATVTDAGTATDAATVTDVTTDAGPVATPGTGGGELATITLALPDGWTRDTPEPGTFSRFLPLSRSTLGLPDTTLVFHYGLEDDAPKDRDAYKQYLAERHLLVVKSERQRGGGWLLEGDGEDGLPAFRHVVMFGGKHLVCWGSAYRDAESNKLGDLRDQVVIEARKICESIGLAD